MNRRIARVLLALSLLVPLTGWARAGEEGAPPATAADGELLDRRISFDLDAVPLAHLAESLSVFGVSLRIEGGNSGELATRPISLCVNRVRLRVVLDAVCDTVDCRWERLAGSPATVSLSALPTPPRKATKGLPERLNERISVSLAGATAKDVFASFVRILAVEVRLDQGLEERTLVVELEDTAVHDVLDAFCRQLGCAWRIEDSPRPTLVVDARR
ncbi:MAG: hypothetical protein IPJ17_03310 [Holophagales bacterium]|nr:MAG: hypothetical protein IPJ17_03310 [Holophagales bacterium]